MQTIAQLPAYDRLVAIDIETTGHPIPTSAEMARRPKGLKLPGLSIEIGCVEMRRTADGWETGATWERRMNPDGPIAGGAMKVHGIHPTMLKTAPRFAEVWQELNAFLGDAPLVAHAAWNEIDFLNYDLQRAGLAAWDEWVFEEDRFFCTQELGSAAFPGAPRSLDALCDRLWVDRSNRFDHHGALLDAMLTAEAFVKLTTGFVSDEVRSAEY